MNTYLVHICENVNKYIATNSTIYLLTGFNVVFFKLSYPRDGLSVVVHNTDIIQNSSSKAWFHTSDGDGSGEGDESMKFHTNPVKRRRNRTEGCVFFCSVSVLQGLCGISCFRL